MKKINSPKFLSMFYKDPTKREKNRNKKANQQTKLNKMKSGLKTVEKKIKYIPFED